jgi:hypothetical protein
MTTLTPYSDHIRHHFATTGRKAAGGGSVNNRSAGPEMEARTGAETSRRGLECSFLRLNLALGDARNG